MLVIVFTVEVLFSDDSLSLRDFKLDVVLLLLLVHMARGLVVALTVSGQTYLNFPEEISLLAVELLLVAQVGQLLIHRLLALHFCKKLAF